MKSRTLLGWWLLSCAIGLPLPLNSPTAVAQTPAAQQLDDLLGNWAFTLPDQNVAWLSLAQSGGQLQGKLLWSVGSAKPVKHLVFENGQLTFERNLKWRPFGEQATMQITGPFKASLNSKQQLRLVVDQIEIGNHDPQPETLRLTGERIPPSPPKPDLSQIRFGEPITLFNGNDLTGWRLSRANKKNGWTVKKGVLVNETPKEDFGAYGDYGNLMTESSFEDFELTIEYNVPAGGNSGIYLRGMYEAQVVDRDSNMQGIQGPGAIFGRLKPSKNAGRPGGQWNRYVLTLVDRHITVELNGETVIDNQLLEGCTGGGIQAHDEKPGPIFLQGDHTSVQYRNLVIRPVVSKPK